jgi:hypothetical protein
MRLRLTIAALFASLAAAVFAGPTSADEPACPEATCSTAIYVHLHRLNVHEPEATKVRQCALGECKDRRNGDSARIPCTGVKSERRARLRVVVYGDGGEVLWRDSTWLRMVKNQPNGPDCPPTCYQAAADLVPGAQEVRAV